MDTGPKYSIQLARSTGDNVLRSRLPQVSVEPRDQEPRRHRRNYCPKVRVERLLFAWISAGTAVLTRTSAVPLSHRSEPVPWPGRDWKASGLDDDLIPSVVRCRAGMAVASGRGVDARAGRALLGARALFQWKAFDDVLASSSVRCAREAKPERLRCTSRRSIPRLRTVSAGRAPSRASSLPPDTRWTSPLDRKLMSSRLAGIPLEFAAAGITQRQLPLHPPRGLN